MIEWIVRLMPAGGHGYPHHEWTDRELQQIMDDFLSSAYGARHGSSDHRELIDSLLWFTSAYGPGDPLHWSPTSVEILLTDWIPRKIVADARYLTQAPAVLRSLISYSHAQRGIRHGLTEETLAAVDRWEPEYQQAIRTSRPQGPAALLAALGAPGADSWLDDHVLSSPWVHGTRSPEWLAGLVGGEEALKALDDRPLPDEPFNWTGIADDIRDRVSEILILTDRACDEILDAEYRTVLRRLLLG